MSPGAGLIQNRRGGAARGRHLLLLPPRMPGGRRSEVKEEGRAQPGPGDMSGVGHPASLARTDA